MKKMKLAGYLFAVAIITAFVIFQSYDCRTPVSLSKKLLFPAHTHNAKNTLSWAVRVSKDSSNDFVDLFAYDLGLVNKGQIGHLEGIYLFHYIDKSRFGKMSDIFNITIASDGRLFQYHQHMFSENEAADIIQKTEEKLDSHPDIVWHSHQKVVSRSRRSMQFQDPFYNLQWHLHNNYEHGMDINVTEVWSHNVTGRGVTVAVVDDGLEWNNPDLEENYNKAGSWDFNGNDDDPMPDGTKESNHHGTRCAGEIAAVPNKVCGVGVAYGAKISGVRILDGPMTDSMEASAFTKHFQINDVFSCSWGPDDDGKTVDGPHVLAAAAMKYGIDFGRHGYGSIYVVASGNGGQAEDNCNYDGYANSIYTVTIGAVDETGHMPFYSEECASMLAVTFSSGTGRAVRDIVTTDWTAHFAQGRSGCTEHHTGTSAAAPIAAGLIALMLEVQPCLTWRDVQYIIILTAKKVDIDEAHWQRNGAGLWHSHKHGFGLMKAWRLVNAAKVWNGVPWLTSFSYERRDINLEIPKGASNPLKISYTVTESQTDGFDLYILETVQVVLSINHPFRGHLQVQLISPHGTRSLIGASRPHDNAHLQVNNGRYFHMEHVIHSKGVDLSKGQGMLCFFANSENPDELQHNAAFHQGLHLISSSAGLDKWTFSTVRCWGETPVGTWLLIITDKDSKSRYSSGFVTYYNLKLFGTPLTPKQLRERRRNIEEAMHGDYLLNNKTAVCIPPHITAIQAAPLSQKILKFLVLTGAFLFIMAIYESLEYLFCYDDEKKEASKQRKLTLRAHRLARNVLASEPNTQRSISETTGLLTEEIPMQTLSSEGQGSRSGSQCSRSYRSRIEEGYVSSQERSGESSLEIEAETNVDNLDNSDNAMATILSNSNKSVDMTKSLANKVITAIFKNRWIKTKKYTLLDNCDNSEEDVIFERNRNSNVANYRPSDDEDDMSEDDMFSDLDNNSSRISHRGHDPFQQAHTACEMDLPSADLNDTTAGINHAPVSLEHASIDLDHASVDIDQTSTDRDQASTASYHASADKDSVSADKTLAEADHTFKNSNETVENYGLS